ncbi:hypothetical protein B0A49_11116 [Cryomyces minteri]|uniref:Zn(2)-C6 fungal-type domain-containing protein n=1 Tax=Cryomyces minteri TaxID=331657 RepID=A0A4U0W628_9PEZI|nr:hypothetical protein B0A49_11116 [Cryomyces minteri]
MDDLCILFGALRLDERPNTRNHWLDNLLATSDKDLNTLELQSQGYATPPGSTHERPAIPVLSDRLDPTALPDDSPNTTLQEGELWDETGDGANSESVASSVSHHTAPKEAPKPLVMLTTCLQCDLKHLPCNRGLPACSRCIRANEGESCLPRRLKTFEDLKAGLYPNATTVYVGIPSDSLVTREKKKTAMKELLEIRQVNAHKENWILPHVAGTKGRYPLATIKSHLLALWRKEGEAAKVSDAAGQHVKGGKVR